MNEPAVDVERAVLGALMSGAEVDDMPCTAADFHLPAHSMIFDAIVRIAATGERPDMSKVRFALGEPSHLYGGPTYLSDLVQASPVAVSAGWHAEQVCEFAVKRRVRDVGMQLVQVGDSDGDGAGILASALERLAEANLGANRGSDVAGIDDVVADVVDQAQHGTRRGLSSPWPDLDRLTRGWYPGRLYIVGARPGIGKSLLASNAAVHTAGQGWPVFVASMEMSAVEWVQRCAAAAAAVDVGRLEEGRLDEQDWERLSRAVPQVSALPLDICDRDTQTVSSIRAGARRAQRKRGKLGMIVVDYLQLLEASDRRRDRHEQVADMSRSLKRLAREFDVPVVALAQVNRASVQRADKWPTMADLRESGSIEADADQVVLLHTEPERPHLVLARVDKGRSTAKGELALQMQGRYSRLLSAAGDSWSPHASLGGVS